MKIRASLALASLAVPAAAQNPLFEELHRMIPMLDARATSIGAADFDLDGDADVIIGHFDGTPTHFYGLNDGTGAFEDASTDIVSIAGRTLDIAMGDFNGDGLEDAILAKGDFTSDFVLIRNQLLLGDGTGGFTTPPLPAGLPTIPDYTEGLGVGDLDNDGDLDVLFANEPTFSFPVFMLDRLLFNDGSANFTDSTLGGVPRQGTSFNSHKIAIDDVNNDGDSDVLFGVFGDLWHNDGTGFFTLEPNMFGPITTLSAEIKFADVDADGDPDAVGTMALYLNNGGSFSPAPTPLPVAPELVESISLGDVDGDGDVDLVGVGSLYPNPPVRVLYYNDGAGVFTDASASLPTIVAEVVHLEDVDGDTDLDLIVGRDGQSEVLLNDGSGVFVDPGVLPVVNGSLAVDIGDVDGDGMADLLVGGTDAALVLRNDGTGLFDAPVSLFPGGAYVRGVALIDVDGDGDEDAVLARDGAQNALLLNDGTGAFSDASFQVPLDQQFSESLATGDLDGDGDLDVYVGNRSTNPENRFWRNDGAGAFDDATWTLQDSSTYTNQVDIGDIDGDGDLDLVSANNGTNFFYLNSGPGLFSPLAAPYSSGTESAELADLDGDGDVDLILGNNGFVQDILATNDGAGGFTSALFGGTSETDDIEVADLNGDGLVDVVLANWFAPNEYLEAQSSGVFTSTPAFASNPSEGTVSVASGDIDGDGDTDLVFAQLSSVGVRVMTSHLRQVAWAGPPRIAKPYTIDVSGPSGEPWFLAWGLGEATITLPPHGILRLNPLQPLVVHDSGLLDASGRASSILPGPSDPALVGAVVNWQAIVGSALQLTNLERTVFSSL